MKEKFYLFGSEDSTDYDVLVSVEEISENIDVSAKLCKYYNEELSKIYPDKPLNCNIGVFDKNQLVKCFKGTVDELNNVIYYTYSNHKQQFENPIKFPIERDIFLKVTRVSRFLLSFYSRTSLRSEIKEALRSGLKDRTNVLNKIDFTTMLEFPGKKESTKDIYKSIAFQFGQTFSLIDGFESESYTKNSIIKNYPDLLNLIKRGNVTKDDLNTLNTYLNRFISLCNDILEREVDYFE